MKNTTTTTTTAPTTAAPHDRLADHIRDVLLDMDTADVVAMWNAYVDQVNAPDDAVYNVLDIDDILAGRKPSDVLGMVSPINRFSFSDCWFWFDPYGFIASSPYPVTDPHSVVDLSEMIDYIIENRDALGNERIAYVVEKLG